jgi:hypothetical protein
VPSAGGARSSLLCLLTAGLLGSAAPTYVRIEEGTRKADPEKVQLLAERLRGHKYQGSSRRASGGGRRLQDTLFSPKAEVETPLTRALDAGNEAVPGAQKRALRMAFSVSNYVDVEQDPDIASKQKYIAKELLPSLGSFLQRSIRVRSL